MKRYNILIRMPRKSSTQAVISLPSSGTGYRMTLQKLKPKNIIELQSSCYNNSKVNEKEYTGKDFSPHNTEIIPIEGSFLSQPSILSKLPPQIDQNNIVLLPPTSLRKVITMLIVTLICYLWNLLYFWVNNY